MKTYLVSSDTNYGLMIHIVNANTPEEALRLAVADPCVAWAGSDTILAPKEIDTQTHGIVLREEARG